MTFEHARISRATRTRLTEHKKTIAGKRVFRLETFDEVVNRLLDAMDETAELVVDGADIISDKIVENRIKRQTNKRGSTINSMTQDKRREVTKDG